MLKAEVLQHDDRYLVGYFINEKFYVHSEFTILGLASAFACRLNETSVQE